MEKDPLNRRDWIAGLEKGLAILEAFDHDHPRLTPTQAAELTGLTRTAARRYLLTLEHLGYLTSEGTLFSLTPRVLKVGWSYFDSARLPRTVQPFLQQITAALGEVAYLSVLDGWELVFISRTSTSRVMSTGFVLGARVPAPLASAGVMMLASQPEEKVREWLETCVLTPYTPYTILQRERLLPPVLRRRVTRVAHHVLCPVQPVEHDHHQHRPPRQRVVLCALLEHPRPPLLRRADALLRLCDWCDHRRTPPHRVFKKWK